MIDRRLHRGTVKYGGVAYMNMYENKINLNPLQTKQDMEEAFRQMAYPLKSHYSEGRTRLQIGNTGSGCPSSTAEIEGFSRVLWGLIPMLAGGIEEDLWDICLEGIRNGTNPEHEEYWGAVADYDQRLVEMAAFGFALALIPDRIWGPQSERERLHLYQWLNQINHHPCHDCNWLFFNVLVNLGFRKAGLSFDQEQMDNNLKRIDDFYLSEGWYSDGVGAHVDYYGPFAIHYYSLLYVKLMGEEDPVRTRMYKERATEFANEFIHWFTPEGAALPYGRSLSYRFAQSAFWSAMAFAEVDSLPLGVVKGLIMRNLRWWFQQPIFDAHGVLTIGYAYPNLIMAENYNAPGSPYWAMKTFLPLALSEDHPFWQAEELPLPQISNMRVQLPAHFVICREEENGHVAGFNTGHLSSNEHTHTSAKYEKFVYSTAFGFSVPRAEWGLSQGAFDSMLALSECDNIFRVKRKNEESFIEDNVLFARWNPWSNVEVKTWIVAGLPWHIRIHRVETQRQLDVAEGGFALGLEFDHDASLSEIGVIASSSHGISGIRNLLGYTRADVIYANANTNIMQTRTGIPTLQARLEPGSHWLISAVLGEPSIVGKEGSRQEDLLEQLNVRIELDEIIITTQSGKMITIKMD